MSKYMIEAGDMVGEYSGDTAEDALDAYAQEAGFDCYADLFEQYGEVDAVWRIDTDRLVLAVSDALKTAVFQDSYGRGVALVDGVSVTDYAELARMGGFDITEFRAD